MSASGPSSSPLSDLDYQQLARGVLDRIEAVVDRWLDDDTVDIDVHRSGGLLELSLPNGSKLVINMQPPLQELWMASRAAGQHFRFVDGQWVDTRSGAEFFSEVSRQISAQAGCTLKVTAA